MLHVEDTPPPYYKYFDIKQVFKEFVDHIAYFHHLSSKTSFVNRYNNWAQSSNAHIRLLKEKKKKWQELSYTYQAYSKLRTVVYVISCLVGLWEGSWLLAGLALTAHILSELTKPILSKKVLSGTLAKMPLKYIFCNIFKMKTFLSPIQEEVKALSSNTFLSPIQEEVKALSSNENGGSIGFYDDSTCRHSKILTLLLCFFPFLNIFCSFIIFFVAYSLYNWTAEDLYSYFLSLLATVAFVSALSYAVSACMFAKQCAVVQTQLANESDNFLKWFDDWITRDNIKIYFCHYKFCFLNLMCFEDQKCLLDDSHCKFLTVWFLISLENLLGQVLGKGNSHAVVSNLFSKIEIDSESVLDVKYIERRLRNALNASHKSRASLRNHIKSHRCFTSSDEPSSQDGGGSVPVPSSCSIEKNTANNCTVCTSSVFCHHPPKTSHFHLNSRPSIQSLNSVGTISYYSAENGYIETYHGVSAPKVSSRNDVICDHNLNLKNYPKTFPQVKRKDSLSSESTISSTQDSDPLKISASESSVSSKGHQRLNYSSVGKRTEGTVCLPSSGSCSDQPTGDILPSCGSVSSGSGTKNCLTTNGKQRYPIEDSLDISARMIPSETYKLEFENIRSSAGMKSISQESKNEELGLGEKRESVSHCSSGNGPLQDSSHVMLSERCRKADADSGKESLEMTRTSAEPNNGELCLKESYDSPSASRCENSSLHDLPDSLFITNQEGGNLILEVDQEEDSLSGFYIVPVYSKLSNSYISETRAKHDGKNENPPDLSVSDHADSRSKSLSLSDYYLPDDCSSESHNGMNPNGKESHNACDKNTCSAEFESRFLSSSETSDANYKSMEFPASEPEKQVANTKNSTESNVSEGFCFPHPQEGKFSGVDTKFLRMTDSIILLNRNRMSEEDLNNRDGFQDFLHKSKSTENFSYPAKAALLPPEPTASISSVLRKSVSDEDSDEMSFPMASSDDENFRFHPESGCTSDTPYSERKVDLGFADTRRSQIKEEMKPTYSKYFTENTSDNEAETSLDKRKGVFKFDNLKFEFDNSPPSKNVTLKFYCESEGECDESVPPIIKKHNSDIHENEIPKFTYRASTPFKNHVSSNSSQKRVSCSQEHEDRSSPCKDAYCGVHDIQICPKRNRNDSESDYCSTDFSLKLDDNATPGHRELKRTVDLNLDGISFNFKRRKNSGPLKVLYHRRQESRDFLFKSRFKRFRFRCGDAEPRSESCEEQGEQEPHESDYELEHSENNSNY